VDEAGLGAESAGLAPGSPISTTSPSASSAPSIPTSSTSTSTSTSTTDQALSKILAEIKQDVFGRKGDFITSPEISQVFGEVSPGPQLRSMIAIEEDDGRMHAEPAVIPSYYLLFPLSIGDLGIRSSSY
jgi:hypothetical protein